MLYLIKIFINLPNGDLIPLHCFVKKNGCETLHERSIHILRAVTDAEFIATSFFVESKALKQAYSKLCNCFSNAAIGKNEQIEARNCGRAKYRLLSKKIVSGKTTTPVSSDLNTSLYFMHEQDVEAKYSMCRFFTKPMFIRGF